MAEDKNGFVLYKDLIHSVKKLPKEKAGELFMHILQYVNDENPETEDLLIELAFEPVKQHLKRDLKKYKSKIDKKSESGRIGNLKKWHPDIYQQFESGIYSLEQAEVVAKTRTSSQRDKSIANIADIDTVSVMDNVMDTVSDISFKKETKDLEGENQNSDRIPQTSKKVAQKKVSMHELEMPPEFHPIWEEWTQYRKARKFKAYAAEKYEQLAVNKLLELSNKDPAIARQILEQTFANNYQGFFPLKNTNNGPNQRFSSTTAATAGNNQKTGKTSARAIFAQRINAANTANSESGNITIDVEAQ